MKSIFEQVISRGGFDLTSLTKNIDRYHIEGKLTDAEHAALLDAARGKAKPQVDSTDEIVRLWAEVKKLKEAMVEVLAALDVTPEDEIVPVDPPEDWPEYVQPTGAHDAYNEGSRITWTDGERYVCMVNGCVWPPDVYPAGWAKCTPEADAGEYAGALATP